MKKFLPCLLFIIILTSFLSKAQSDDKYSLRFLSGTVHPEENVGKTINLSANVPDVFYGKYYRIIQFYQIPTDEQKQALKDNGIELLIYLPEMAWFASINQDAHLSSLQPDIRSIISVLPEYKIHPALKDNKLPVTAEVVKGKADLILTYYTNIPSSLAVNELKSKFSGIEILAEDEVTHWVQVRVKKEMVESLTQLSFIQYVEPVSKSYVENNSGTTEHRSNTINNFIPGGLRFDGTGVGVSIGDGGTYFGHIDLKGRQTGATSPGVEHATHVAGTIGGAGNINPRYRGQAPGVNMIYYSSHSDISTFSVISNLYNGSYKIRVTNHSLAQTENDGYTSDARQSDLNVAALPSLFNVHSAGNNGTNGWFTITGGYKASKNCISVGNLDYKDVVESSSSRGPTKDGRLKPDICAKGTSVTSCTIANDYVSLTGTSMSSPGIAGCVAQLIDAYRALKGGNDPKLGELKCIMLNTSEDLGNAGPDYTYGWGRINTLKAYNAINENRYFSSSITNGQSNTHTIPVPAGVSELRVMVYWADPAAAAGVSKALINDIDIALGDGSQTYYPWKLNSASPTALATKGQDRDNNMEQVTVSSPLAGSYTLTVSGYLVPQGPQQYWVTYEYLTDDIKVTYPIGGESFVPGETEYIRWDTYGTVGNFKVEYSTDSGATWIVKSSIVSGYARYYNWVVPSVVTGKTLVRVSRNGKSSTSETVFNILNVPTNLKVDWRCTTNFQLSWNAVNGATSYEVFLLGQKYMVSQGTTANLNYVITAPNTSVTWASVGALADNGQTIGRRAIAVQVGTTVSSCVPTLVDEMAESSPDGMNVYPNPMNGQATVSLYLEKPEIVSIRVIDILGKEMSVIAEGKKLSSGEHLFNLKNNFTEGVCFLVVSKESGTLYRKIITTRD